MVVIIVARTVNNGENMPDDFLGGLDSCDLLLYCKKLETAPHRAVRKERRNPIERIGHGVGRVDGV